MVVVVWWCGGGVVVVWWFGGVVLWFIVPIIESLQVVQLCSTLAWGNVLLSSIAASYAWEVNVDIF